MTNHRLLKINADIVRAVSEIIMLEARDEILKSITITDCRVSSDLSYAKVYFTSLREMEEEKLVKEVNEAGSFIRMKLAERLDLRHTPKLEFVYDNSIAYANNIERIIKELHEGE